MKTRRKRNAPGDPKLIEKLFERLRNLKVDPKLIEKIRKRCLKLELIKEAAEPEAQEQDYVRDVDGTFVFFHGFLPGAKLSERQLEAERRRLSQRVFPTSPRRPVRDAKTSLYLGKLDRIWGKPLAAVKWIAEEIRTNPSVGWRLLEQQCKLRGNVKGFVPKMLKALGKCLEDEQPVFDKMDYQIVDIVQQHPDYTIKEITSAVSEQYPERKWTEPKLKTLARRVQRLLKHDPYLPR
jgi:hypothetical protein